MSESKCHILYVDDHEDSGEMFKLLLAPMDYEVHLACTVEEALQLVRTKRFDLYVLDKRLPDGSGIELCKQLNELTSGVPCIFYSGDAYRVQRDEALAAGADAFVPKPEVEKLIETVNKFLTERECAAA